MSSDETIIPSSGEEPTDVPSLRTVVTDSLTPGMPRRIGKYDIKRIIGSGGMGAVYLAVQEQPRRTVALKVMRSGIASRVALRRFEYESQLLARLQHQGIAQIYEAGTHEDNGGPVPYFAMEYISGATWLIEFADTKKLDTRSRLQLFLQVCDAMSHAHQKGIIHRDLKPANILVNSAGLPKVIDFGVARGSDADMAGATLQTNLGQLVGTLQYMSPEQCAGDPHNVDVRSDVYTLGVILYELLSGKSPYDISSSSIPEATQIVCTKPPTRLSTINRSLRGDLETIVLKSLDKDRDKRYQSVADFAADVGRYLEGQPILAKPVGPIGRLAKWVRRNKEVAVVLSIAAIAIVTVSSVLLYRVVDAKRQAEQNLKAAKQNFALVRDMLRFRDNAGDTLLSDGVVNPERLLDEAANSLASISIELPATEADFREILGIGYSALRKFPKAKENLTKTLEIRQKIERNPSPGIADALHNLAAAMFNNGEYEPAEKLYRKSYSMRQALFPGDHKDIAFSLTHLATCELKFGHFPQAEDLFKKALAMRQRLYKGDHEEVAASLNNLAKLYVEREQYEEAEPLFRQSLGMVRTLTMPEKNQQTLLANASHNLGQCLYEMGRFEDALTKFMEARNIREKRNGPESAPFAISMLGVARAYLRLHKLDQAATEAEAAKAILGKALRSNHPDNAEAFATLGAIFLAKGDAAAAEPLLKSASEIVHTASQPVQLDVAEKDGLLGECLGKLNRPELAEPLLTSAFETQRTIRGEKSRYTLEAAQRLADFYKATGNATKANEMSLFIYRAKPAPK